MLQRCSRSVLPLVRSGTRRPALSIPRNISPEKPRHFTSGAHSQTAASGSAANTGSTASPLTALASELDTIAPRFEIDADDVRILKEPAEFFSVLKEKILGAKKRIYLATLYIGKTEHELIDTLRQALRNNPDLTVSILTDYFRGTREAPHPCCASLLAPLITEFGAHRVQIRMWHTPNLTGVRERLLPKRINEGWGLQHMKLYAADDELILSGANLSSDYFTNRQDRYHVFRSRELTEYYERVYDATCAISYDVQPAPEEAGFTLKWPENAGCVSPREDPGAYVRYAGQLLAPLISPPCSSEATTASSDSHAPGLSSPRTSAQARAQAPADLSKAVIYPLFQLAPVTKYSTELPALTHLLSSLARPPFYPATWTFTAGYFNMTPGVRDLLLAAVSSRAQGSENAHSNAASNKNAADKTEQTNSTANPRPHGTVLTAHPHANGFHGSAGISGLLPPAYTFLASRFLRTVLARKLESNITLMEWKKGECGMPRGWTYHAKGLWITLPSGVEGESSSTSTSTSTCAATPADAAAKVKVKVGEQGGANPSLSLIGSSNYTARSHTLDLEANALILTSNASLQERLRDEEAALRDVRYVKAVGLDEYARTERRVSWRVRVALWIVGIVGGAL